MRVLIVKTSSMGDVIHTLPAVEDATRAIPGIEFDWVVEENFAEIPSWHSSVKQVIPVALRRWRKNILQTHRDGEWKAFKHALQAREYDYVIDAQGLLKSALITAIAKGKRCGFNWGSAREPLASLVYQQKYQVEKGQHAIARVRELFAQVLGYTVSDPIPDYGIDKSTLIENTSDKYVLCLHGTTWTTKHWPEAYWIELATSIAHSGLHVKLPWGNEIEKQRAERIAAAHDKISVLPKLNLHGIAAVVAGAKAIVAVDTGLGHLAAALNIPTISLYGPTNAALTGALGASQVHLQMDFACAPCLQRECSFRGSSTITPACFKTMPPKAVFEKLSNLL